ncbi:hypothetical protein D7X87_22750 [bacterium D16-54]|nr:hypothetical protein D7X87_22750 [bacterium D16-54]RKJ10519.1 hypothetical protein D7X65_23150 [bacterium D16-56]
MGKLSKARKRSSGEVTKSRQDQYDRILKTAPCGTWSARMPAYCFTVLCPDVRYRPEGGKYIKWQKK